MARYRRGEKWWLESAGLIADATTEQDARYAILSPHGWDYAGG